MQSSWRGQYSKYKDFFLSAYQTYTKKEEVKMSLEIILSLFTSALFIVFALKPTAITILELLKSIKEKEQTLSLMDQKIVNTQKAKDIFSASQDTITLTLNSVPDHPEPDNLSTQIQGLSSQDGVSVGSISVSPTAILGKGSSTTIPNTDALPDNVNGASFSLNVSSQNYVSLINFLSDLKKLRRAIKIDSVKLSTTDTLGGSALTIAITGRVAYLSNN